MPACGRFLPYAVQDECSFWTLGESTVHDPTRTLGAMSAQKGKPKKAAVPLNDQVQPTAGGTLRLHAFVMFFIAVLQGQLLALIFYGNQGRSRRVSLFGLYQ